MSTSRLEIAKGAAEIAVDDFIDSHLQERPRTVPEMALPPAMARELQEVRQTPGTPRAGTAPARPAPRAGPVFGAKAPLSPPAPPAVPPPTPPAPPAVPPRPAPEPEVPYATLRTDVRGLLHQRDEQIAHLESELDGLKRELEAARRASRPSDQLAREAPASLDFSTLDDPTEFDEATTSDDLLAGLDGDSNLQSGTHSIWRRVPPPERPLGSAPPVALAAQAPPSPQPGAPAALDPPAPEEPVELSPDVPAVFQFGPSTSRADAQHPAALASSGAGAHALAPALGEASAAVAWPAHEQPAAGPSPGEPPQAQPARVRFASWSLLLGLVGALGLAGLALYAGWVALSGASSPDASSSSTAAAPESTAAAAAPLDAPTAVASLPAPSEAPSATARQPAPAPTPSAAPSVAEPAASAAQPVPEPSAPEPAPSASTNPADGAPSPGEPPAEPVPDATLLSFQAHVTVLSPIDAEVVVQGVGIGRTNQRLLARCGPRNVRLRADDGRWLSEGTHAQLTCMHHTTIRVAPDAL